MKIGEFAKQAGVNVQTVRYYERRGLLPEPERRASGYRKYSTDCLQRLQFIRRAQELGFTLAEIGDLLALRLDPDTTADDVKHRAVAKLDDIEGRIRDLQQVRTALQHLAGECDGGAGPTGDCPLLAAMGPLEPAGCAHD